MRTTLDIPDTFGKRVKMAALRRGVTMKDLIVTALEHELDAKKADVGVKALQFPLVSSKTPACYELKPEQISDILLREEVFAYETVDRH